MLTKKECFDEERRGKSFCAIAGKKYEVPKMMMMHQEIRLVMMANTDQVEDGIEDALCFLSDSMRRVRSHICSESWLSPKLRDMRRARVSKECKSSGDTFEVCRISTKSSCIWFWTGSDIEKSICLIEVRYRLILSSSSWFRYSLIAENVWSGSSEEVT